MKLLITILMFLSASAFGDNLPDGSFCKRDYDCEANSCLPDNNGGWVCGKPVGAGIKNGHECGRSGDSGSGDFNCESGWCKQNEKNINKFACHERFKDGHKCNSSNECESKVCASKDDENYMPYKYHGNKKCGVKNKKGFSCDTNDQCETNYCKAGNGMGGADTTYGACQDKVQYSH